MAWILGLGADSGSQQYEIIGSPGSTGSLIDHNWNSRDLSLNSETESACAASLHPSGNVNILQKQTTDSGALVCIYEIYHLICIFNNGVVALGDRMVQPEGMAASGVMMMPRTWWTR